MDALARELDKRSIRILLGYICTDPAGLKALNDLAAKVANNNARCDHETICQIGKQVLGNTKIGDTDFRALLDNWAAVKLGSIKGRDLVQRRAQRLGIAAPDPDTDPTGFMRLFQGEVDDTFKALKFLSQKAMENGSRELKPLFDERAAFGRAAKDPNVTQAEREHALRQFDILDNDIRYRMTSMTAWYPKLGGHLDDAQHGENEFKANYRQAFEAVGADSRDFQRAFEGSGMKQGDIDRELKKLTPPAPAQPGDGAFLPSRERRLPFLAPHAVPAIQRRAA